MSVCELKTDITKRTSVRYPMDIIRRHTEDYKLELIARTVEDLKNKIADKYPQLDPVSYVDEESDELVIRLVSVHPRWRQPKEKA